MYTEDNKEIFYIQKINNEKKEHEFFQYKLTMIDKNDIHFVTTNTINVFDNLFGERNYFEAYGYNQNQNEEATRVNTHDYRILEALHDGEHLIEDGAWKKRFIKRYSYIIKQNDSYAIIHIMLNDKEEGGTRPKNIMEVVFASNRNSYKPKTNDVLSFVDSITNLPYREKFITLFNALQKRVEDATDEEKELIKQLYKEHYTDIVTPLVDNEDHIAYVETFIDNKSRANSLYKVKLKHENDEFLEEALERTYSRKDTLAKAKLKTPYFVFEYEKGYVVITKTMSFFEVYLKTEKYGILDCGIPIYKKCNADVKALEKEHMANIKLMLNLGNQNYGELYNELLHGGKKQQKI